MRTARAALGLLLCLAPFTTMAQGPIGATTGRFNRALLSADEAA